MGSGSVSGPWGDARQGGLGRASSSGLIDPNEVPVLRIAKRGTGQLMFLEQRATGWLERLDGYSPCDLRALPGLRVNLECPADRVQPVGHALQTGPIAGLRGIKPVAAVEDLEGEFPLGL